MSDRDDARRANQKKNRNPHACRECWGDVMLPSGYLRHAPDCWRLQDEEAATLRRLGAAFPVHDDLGAEYEPQTSYRGVSDWEPAEYDLGGAR